MNDVELVQHVIDSLDTGLPERPDLGPVRSAGAAQRRRRRFGWTAGACAAAGVLVVPAMLLAGPGGGPALAPDPAGSGRVAAPAPVVPSVPAGDLAGPDFGVGMTAAVQRAVPGATLSTESLGDGWAFSEDQEAWDWTVGDPVQWATLYLWEQLFTTPNGGQLDVVATRTMPEVFLGEPGPMRCAEAQYPSRRSCQVSDVGGRRVMVNDGIQYSEADHWYRDVNVFYFDAARGMPAHVALSAWVVAPSWSAAQDLLPSVEDLTQLGLDSALVLPEPDHYPVPDDLEEHMTSTP